MTIDNIRKRNQQAIDRNFNMVWDNEVVALLLEEIDRLQASLDGHDVSQDVYEELRLEEIEERLTEEL